MTEDEKRIVKILSKENLDLGPNYTLEIAKKIISVLSLNKECSIPCEVVNNQLNTITYLIDMCEMEEFERAKKALPKAKKTVNILSDRDVYELERVTK